jgi:nucleoside-diphosphate-sugar epimerase
MVPCLQGKVPGGRKDHASLRHGGDRGAKQPLRLPAWLGRLLAGEFVVAQMTTSRGSSNEKARKELGWEPRYASWREGFRAWVRG